MVFKTFKEFTMIDDTKIKQYPREASPKQMADLLEKLERDRQMTGSDGRYDKPKPKKTKSKRKEEARKWRVVGADAKQKK